MMLGELVTLVDAELHRFLSERKSVLRDAAPLIEEIDVVISAGGKRLRPAFCYWGFRAAGAEHCEEIVRAAAALELLHTFAIVHDDVMDESSRRRGQATTHERRGLSFAILTGDLALVLADAALVGSGFSSEVVTRAFDVYSRMRQEVIAGQLLDVELSRALSVSEEDARRVAILKSGRYSVQEPLRIGATLGGSSDDLIEELASLGEPLGEAFQLRDDLLGIFGDPGVVGKPVDSDIREGKRNVLYAKTVASLEGADKAFFMSRWGRRDELTDDDVELLRDMVDRSGARREVEELLGRLLEQALARLAVLDVPEDARAALAELARLVAQRRG
jgi:geranylgeranyl diphosphate synthase type I